MNPITAESKRPAQAGPAVGGPAAPASANCPLPSVSRPRPWHSTQLWQCLAASEVPAGNEFCGIYQHELALHDSQHSNATTSHTHWSKSPASRVRRTTLLSTLAPRNTPATRKPPEPEKCKAAFMLRSTIHPARVSQGDYKSLAAELSQTLQHASAYVKFEASNLLCLVRWRVHPEHRLSSMISSRSRSMPLEPESPALGN